MKNLARLDLSCGHDPWYPRPVPAVGSRVTCLECACTATVLGRDWWVVRCQCEKRCYTRGFPRWAQAYLSAIQHQASKPMHTVTIENGSGIVVKQIDGITCDEPLF